MQFNSLDYLVFLTLALCAYWALRRARAARLVLTLGASCLFYVASALASDEVRQERWLAFAYLGLIFATTLVDWWVARSIHASTDEAVRKRWIGVSVAVNLSVLGFFKYWDFGSGALAQGLGAIGIEVAPPVLHLVLPIGVSFYTFESLSYCIDVYRRKSEPAKTPLELLFFITFFPKLVAGPIARPSELLPQLEGLPRIDRERVSGGLFLIATGLAKKIVLADYVSVNLVDRVFEAPDNYTSAEVVIALYGFTLQMYADFSGYTDVARGSAKLFGIELPENFDRPYQARSPAEFWRRWHMTLSTWLRDYLYFPLGGSRLGEARTYFNLWLTIFLIGLWHGASWTFVLYGAIQGTAVALHRYVSRAQSADRELTGGSEPKGDPLWLVALKVFGTLQFCVFSRILFRASDLENAGAIVSRITEGSGGVANVGAGVFQILVLGFALHYTPKEWKARARAGFSALPAPAQGLALAVVLGLLSLVSTAGTVPYIYFQF